MEMGSLLADIKKRRKKDPPKKPQYIEYYELFEYFNNENKNKNDNNDDQKEQEQKQEQNENNDDYVTIACISDTHGQHRKLKMPKADILIHSGDWVSNGFSLEETIDVNSWFGELIEKKTYKDIICIAGNHEGYTSDSSPIDGKMIKKYMTNCHFLEDESITIESIKFYGSPWISCNENNINHYGEELNYIRNDDYLNEKFSEIDNDIDYLITHGPPYLILDNKNNGNLILLKHLKRLKNLQVVQFGHVHNSRGYCYINKLSLLYNDGDDDNDHFQFWNKQLVKWNHFNDIKKSYNNDINDIVLFINAANDDYGDPPNQPFWFKIPKKKQT